MRIAGQRTVQDEGRAMQKPGDGNELDVGKEQRGQCVRVFGPEGKGEMLKLRLPGASGAWQPGQCVWSFHKGSGKLLMNFTPKNGMFFFTF